MYLFFNLCCVLRNDAISLWAEVVYMQLITVYISHKDIQDGDGRASEPSQANKC